ncbi:MAG: lycopene cyclase family protein [Acidobacteriota bacterium]
MAPRRVAIVGAGLSGLSLAVQLAESAAPVDIVLFDRRETFGDDRTWCFWDVTRHPFESAVSRRWSSWELRSGAQHLKCSTARHDYVHVASRDFYRQALERLHHAGRAELRFGESVLSIEDRPESARVVTTAGEFAADVVFDSRPSSASRWFGRGLVQQFYGMEVLATRPTFDPATVTLMDFVSAGNEGVHFFYVLPFDSQRALVESTWITSTPRGSEALRSEVESYLRNRFGLCEPSTLRTEAGAIPMHASRKHKGASRVVPIGLGGGWARPSTGYAFLATQLCCAAIVRDLEAGRPARAVDGTRRRAQFLDRVFLRALERQPHGAPDLFLAPFAGAGSDAAARFLSDTGSLLDDLRVVYSMPKSPMLKALLERQPRPASTRQPREGAA